MKYLAATLSLLFYSVISFAFRDTANGFTAPANVSADAHKLAWHLCDDVISDTQKANLVYNWITHNIAFDIKANKDPDRPTPVVQKILAEKKATSDGYALLYMEMCKEVGLAAVMIEGYAKGWAWDKRDFFYQPRHKWCAVMIDRRWELVDPTAGAGGIVKTHGWFRSQLNKLKKEEKIVFAKKEVFEFDYNPYYFMCPPQYMRYSHLPSDPLWQLMKTPMPLDVFEKGDTAIAAYNELFSERVNRGTELEYISRLNEQQKQVEAADREYKFNKRFDAVLAYKESIRAQEVIAKYASRRNVPPRSRFEDAYRGMVLAQGFLKKQAGYIPEQYNELKKKNITKNKIAGDRIRAVRTHNRSLSALCRTHKLTAERKLAVLGTKEEKAELLADRITPERIDSIKTATVEREKESPAMRSLMDSIKAKQARLKKINFGVLDKMQSITLLQEENTTTKIGLDSAVALADTLLLAETELRLGFVDDYDDEIISCVSNYKLSKFEAADSLQKKYIKNFDTLVLQYELLMQLYLQQADLHRNTLRDMEQYRRWNSEEQVTVWYANACKGYSECMSQYRQTMEIYKNYLVENGKVFEDLSAIYDDELHLADRMEEAEIARKEAEDTELNEDKSFDERVIAKQQVAATEQLKVLTEILSK